MADAATTTADTTTAATTTTTTPWYEGKADAETIGHWDNKGWKKDDPATIAIEATKAAREAQKIVGVPPEQIIKLPKEVSDEAGWKAVWQRLGVPAENKEYSFDGVKRADGSDLEEGFAASMREALGKAHVAKESAKEVVKAVVKYLDDADTEKKAAVSASLIEEKATLERSWGKNYQTNMFLADQAARALGIKEEHIAALKNVAGAATVAEMFRQIAVKIGEPSFVTAGGSPAGGPMTREGAQARFSELKADQDWIARYQKGDAKARREFNELTTIIAGEAA